MSSAPISAGQPSTRPVPSGASPRIAQHQPSPRSRSLSTRGILASSIFAGWHLTLHAGPHANGRLGHTCGTPCGFCSASVGTASDAAARPPVHKLSVTTKRHAERHAQEKKRHTQREKRHADITIFGPQIKLRRCGHGDYAGYARRCPGSVGVCCAAIDFAVEVQRLLPQAFLLVGDRQDEST